MRLSRPQLTVGRLLVLVAVLGLVLGLVVLGWRWDYCRRQADQHEETAQVLRDEIAVIKARQTQPNEVAIRQMALADEEQEARRFRAAQRQPWLGVRTQED